MAPKCDFCLNLVFSLFITIYLYLAVFRLNYPYLGIFALNCPDFTIYVPYSPYMYSSIETAQKF